MQELIAIQSPNVDHTPASRFSVLFLIAEVDVTKTSAVQIAKRAWGQVQTVAPLLQKRPLPPSRAFAVYCDAAPIAIDFQREGKKLVAPEAQRNTVLDRVTDSTANCRQIGLWLISGI